MRDIKGIHFGFRQSTHPTTDRARRIGRYNFTSARTVGTSGVDNLLQLMVVVGVAVGVVFLVVFVVLVFVGGKNHATCLMREGLMSGVH